MGQNVCPSLQFVICKQSNQWVTQRTNARWDIAARGLWGKCDKTFSDVRITHPLSPSYSNKTFTQLYQLYKNENIQWKNNLGGEGNIQSTSVYNQWRHGPRVYPHQQEASRNIAQQHKEPLSIMLKHIPAIMRFSLLKSTLVAIRDFWGSTYGD